MKLHACSNILVKDALTSSSVMLQLSFKLDCAADVTKLCLSLSVKQRRNPCSGSPTLYRGLSTCHDWPVENAIVDLPIRLKGNLKCSSGNLLSPLEAQNKEISAALQSLLTEEPCITSVTLATLSWFTKLIKQK